MTTPLRLNDLSDRHPGLTKAIGETYAEAAAVCLSRHHESPIDVNAIFRNQSVDCNLLWLQPDIPTLRAHANEIDATEQGAYGVSLAAVEAIAGLVAMRRAETLTGADYYVAPIGSDPEDLEDCIRLEVSGLNNGGQADIKYRLSQKLKQAEKGISNLPAIAAVIGFRERLIAIAKLGDDQ